MEIDVRSIFFFIDSRVNLHTAIYFDISSQSDPFHITESFNSRLGSTFLTNAGFILMLASNMSKVCGNLTKVLWKHYSCMSTPRTLIWSISDLLVSRLKYCRVHVLMHIQLDRKTWLAVGLSIYPCGVRWG